MEKELELILNELLDIYVNLRKLGPARRLKYKDSVNDKISRANSLYLDCKHIVSIFLEKSSSLDLEVHINDIKESIESTYRQILSFQSNVEQEQIGSKMDKFDIKTAASLIPMMDNTEETTEKIIDSIEMYNDCLQGIEQKKLLISFILKTRLTKSAKLKLKSEYSDVASLVIDIKKYLLTKKSANTILYQLNNLSQNNLSINEFGNKLSDLFIGLTITQADGNEKACEILRPINEKLAIKRFADGLKNRRLSTIISARDYSELKDAVRAAEDEELAQPSTSHNIFSARGKTYNNYYKPSGSRGYHYSQQRSRFRGNQTFSRPIFETFNSNRGFIQNNVRHSRGRSAAFRSTPRSTRNIRSRGNYRSNVFVAQPYDEFRTRGEQHDANLAPNISSSDHLQVSENEIISNNQFFRA